MLGSREHGEHSSAIWPRRTMARNFSTLAASREPISCFGFEIDVEMSFSSNRITSARRDLGQKIGRNALF